MTTVGDAFGQEKPVPVDSEKNFALEPAPEQPGQTERAPDGPGIADFLYMLFVLAVVVGVIYLFFYFLKKISKGKNKQNDLIKVLDFKELTGSNGLHLIEIGNETLLVGSSANHISLIKEISDKDSLDQIKFQLAQKDENKQALSFKEIMARVFKTKTDKGVSVSESLGFMDEQKKRLKNLRE